MTGIHTNSFFFKPEVTNGGTLPPYYLVNNSIAFFVVGKADSSQLEMHFYPEYNKVFKLYFKETDMKSVVAVSFVSLDEDNARITILNNKGHLYDAKFLTNPKLIKEKELTVSPQKLNGQGYVF